MTAFLFNTNSALFLAFATPIVGGLGWLAWIGLRKLGRLVGRVLIIDPMKSALNEVVDERLEQPLSHVHECFERRTDEIVHQLDSFAEENRADRELIHAGGAEIVTYGEAERERIWCAIQHLADHLEIPDIRPPASLDQRTKT